MIPLLKPLNKEVLVANGSATKRHGTVAGYLPIPRDFGETIVISNFLAASNITQGLDAAPLADTVRVTRVIPGPLRLIVEHQTVVVVLAVVTTIGMWHCKPL